MKELANQNEACRSLRMKKITKIVRVCEFCFNSRFDYIGDGKRRCKKCGQIYYDRV